MPESTRAGSRIGGKGCRGSLDAFMAQDALPDVKQTDQEEAALVWLKCHQTSRCRT